MRLRINWKLSVKTPSCRAGDPNIAVFPTAAATPDKEGQSERQMKASLLCRSSEQLRFMFRSLQVGRERSVENTFEGVSN